jgi:hypothetical protein
MNMYEEEDYDGFEDDVPLYEDTIVPEPSKLTAVKVSGGIRLEYLIHDGLPAMRVYDAYGGEIALFTDAVSQPWELKKSISDFNEHITNVERYMQAVCMFSSDGKGM